ncbi:hypothetical protein [Deinococcus yavapaiensis]|uniref:Uncharacterized protein n=1 Tax=Deinococcus yavapaiensis KR-236 TaxID=694435 RepID=A0A318S993_9DEIO|nr:hypothetical protein [Deinococcus yavapaiensis]PYE54788.1 hypothetical protein DES52_10458 [Deinococcus yavapaiensis KR-236]
MERSTDQIAGDSLGVFDYIVSEIHAWPKGEGVKLGDLVHISDPLRTTLQRVIREGSVTLDVFSSELALDPAQTNAVVDLLLDHGFLKTVEDAEDGEPHYRLWYARAHRRDKPLDVWTKVLDHLDETDA